MDYRAIFFHKQATSARLRFLRFAHGSVCAPEPLPADAQLQAPIEGCSAAEAESVLEQLHSLYEFGEDSLQIETEFACDVLSDTATMPVLLVGIDRTDPPFELAEGMDASFIDLTQARGLPPLELQLLRQAYECVLGG